MIQSQTLIDAEIERRMCLSSSAIKAVCVQWEIMEIAVLVRFFEVIPEPTAIFTCCFILLLKPSKDC